MNKINYTMLKNVILYEVYFYLSLIPYLIVLVNYYKQIETITIYYCPRIIRRYYNTSKRLKS